MSCDPYAASASWTSVPSKTLINAIVRVGLPIPAMPTPKRASIEIQWVDATGKCSDVYAMSSYADIVQLAMAVDGVGRLHYADHTESVIGSILTQLIQ